MSTEAVKTSPKDFFLHLLAILTLYFSAGAFLTLVFQYINVLLPDVLESFYSRQGIASAIRWAISTAIIVFPVYVWATWFLNKDYHTTPLKRNLWIRKWLVYFTIFVAAGIIIGDLIVLINNFLEGELTVRFILKVIAVLFVAGSVFGYYLSDIRNPKSRGRKILSYVVIGIMALAIVVGFFMVGSPAEERLHRFDQQRISHLQFIQSEVLNYWINKEALPDTLDDLQDDIRGTIAPQDPQTGEDYTYNALRGTTFELCANFALSSIGDEERFARPFEKGLSQNWEHKDGLVCFERTIDPDFYEKNR